jgi:hypothetical protein
LITAGSRSRFQNKNEKAENKMIKEVTAILSAFATNDAFMEVVEKNTRIITGDLLKKENVDLDVENQEHGEAIGEWIRTNPKYDFLSITNPEDLETKIIVLEKETDAFVTGRKVKIKGFEKGSIHIGSGTMTIKDGVDPVFFGKKIREATTHMERR